MSFENPFKKAALKTEQHEQRLSPEAQEIASELQVLSEEKNQMAIRMLCAGNGGAQGAIDANGIGFRLLGNPGDDLEAMQFQLEGGGWAYNFRSWMDNLGGLAADLAKRGLTAKQLKSLSEAVQDASSRVEKRGEGWVVTQYGPNNEATIPLADLLRASQGNS